MNRWLKITSVTLIFLFTFCHAKKEKITTATSSSQTTPLPTEQTPVGLNLGNLAPEISLKNPEGTLINLSSLRGKVVLIDFWASWCGPCRHENPAVVKAYKRYSEKKLKGGKGFAIYSVSLDTDVQAWKRAIEKDSLLWQSHVSDLRGWANVAASQYGVTGIPSNFLINDRGIIIDKNLRGEALINTLDKLTVH